MLVVIHVQIFMFQVKHSNLNIKMNTQKVSTDFLLGGQILTPGYAAHHRVLLRRIPYPVPPALSEDFYIIDSKFNYYKVNKYVVVQDSKRLYRHISFLQKYSLKMEYNIPQICTQDINEYICVSSMLEFMNENRCTLSTKYLPQLLLLAVTFQYDALVRTITAAMIDNLSRSTTVASIQVAMDIDSPVLLEKSLMFLSQDYVLDYATKTQKICDLSYSDMDVIVRFFAMTYVTVKETLVARAIDTWGTDSPTKRQHVVDLFKAANIRRRRCTGF